MELLKLSTKPLEQMYNLIKLLSFIIINQSFKLKIGQSVGIYDGNYIPK